MRLGFVWLGAIAVAACSRAPSGSDGPTPGSDAERYAEDTGWRRAELEASLVNADNAYSKLRLAHYAGGDAKWDALPEWNPRVDPIVAGEIDDGTAARATMTAQAGALPLDGVAITDEYAMVALGERAYFQYPTQLATYAATALASRDAAARYGLWIDDARGVNGLVRAEMADGSAAIALTCASCHAARDAGALVVGVGNDALDLGMLLTDTGAPGTGVAYATWGRGRVDVTTSDGSAPVRIPDLRPTRWLTHLHHDATVRYRDRASLAIRLETLIITSHGEALRPPRVVAWALAAYLESLADALPAIDPAGDAATHGAAIFATECASCHGPPGFTGPPVPIDVVGTDPAIGLSPDRGTGDYRVPSLRGVGSRPLLLHDASVPSLDVLFDPARTTAGYAKSTRGGAVPGHAFGLELSDADRADLVTYLRAL